MRGNNLGTLQPIDNQNYHLQFDRNLHHNNNNSIDGFNFRRLSDPNMQNLQRELASEKRKNQRLTKKLEKRESYIEHLKRNRQRLVQDLYKVQTSNQNIIMHMEQQKQLFDSKILETEKLIEQQD